MRYAFMKWMFRLPAVFVLLLAFLMTGLVQAEPYKAEPGPYEVDSFLLDLHDAERGRDVPIKVYCPLVPGGEWPVVLVSHGLGGSREGLSYLGSHWASHGYLCVHMQHVGSDEGVWKGLPAKDVLPAMRKAARTPQIAVDRAYDVPFVLDQLEALNREQGSRLYAMIGEGRKAAIAGHSFGAWSAMAAGGMSVGGVRGQSFADDRIACMIPLSPPVAQKRRREASYQTLGVPALFMTGTLDTSVINSTKAEERLIPYQLMPGPGERDDGQPKYLINFDSADHMTFSGETKARPRSKVSLEDNQAFHAIILQSTTAFLDSYLLEDEDARAWLNGEGFVDLVGERGEVRREVE